MIPVSTRTTSADPMRRIALAGGIAYLVTFAASVPQLALFAGVVEDRDGSSRAPSRSSVWSVRRSSSSRPPAPCSARGSRSRRWVRWVRCPSRCGS